MSPANTSEIILARPAADEQETPLDRIYPADLRRRRVVERAVKELHVAAEGRQRVFSFVPNPEAGVNVAAICYTFDSLPWGADAPEAPSGFVALSGIPLDSQAAAEAYHQIVSEEFGIDIRS